MTNAHELHMGHRQILKIPVFGPGIDEAVLCEAVRDYGFVIVEEAKPEVRRLVEVVKARLGILPESDRPPYLLHLSDPVDDHGWIDYLIHSDVADDTLRIGRTLLIRGVQAWLASGRPDYFLARVERPSAYPEQEPKMPRTNLNVPFAEKDEAKALGARWDAAARCWYVPAGMGLASFIRWRPDLRADESLANVRAECFGVAFSTTFCWKCAAAISVACLVVGASHEQVEYDEDDDFAYWQPAPYASALGTVTYVSEAALLQVAAVAPWLKMTYSRTVEGSYWGNTCQQCGALQGDFFLHSEPGGAFFPMDEVERSRIRIRWFDVPLEANASQIGIDTEWVSEETASGI